MNLFGAVLESAVLELPHEIGADIHVSAPVNTVSAAINPAAVSTGGIVALASPTNARSDVIAPSVGAGVNVILATPVGSAAGSVAPTVATSAHITVDAPVDTVVDSNAPTVVAGTDVAPAPPVDTAATSNAPAVLAGASVILASPAGTASSAAAPAVASGKSVILNSAVDSATAAQAPALVGGGTTVFPVISFSVTRAFDIGAGFGGTVLEFSNLEGPAGSSPVTVLTSARSFNGDPSVVSGKNVILVDFADSVSTPRAPDIETERRRRMAQAIAA